ncbi:hypothetical protein [Candidatus Cyanaurora vandensis]|uniref:hypothetical protein n=1 Tax=Candidatus Cyanaurora vandensis TaxID=2714958 RepID=UPI002579E420|nr:hypothetical protein [Candidatus Cyanaurora vandensis]
MFPLSRLSGLLAVALSIPVLAEGQLQITTPIPKIVANRLVFSTVKKETRAPQTITLKNIGNSALTVTALTLGNSPEINNAVSGRTVDYQRASDFRLVTPPMLPLTLAPNSTITLIVEFVPQRTVSLSNNPTHSKNGECYAALTIVSDDPIQSNFILNLAGLNTITYEGNNEPSLAEISRAYGWSTHVGQENNVLGGAKTWVGEEVYSPYWVRADAANPVRLWPLAAFSKRVPDPYGYSSFYAKPGSGGNGFILYSFAGTNNDDSPTGIEVQGSNDLSGGENQKLLPKIFKQGSSFTPTPGSVSFNPTRAFGIRNDGISSDDNLNIDAVNGVDTLHNWRFWSVRDPQGKLVPNQWLAAKDNGNTSDPETGKNFDYQDEVFLLTNAKPEISAQDPNLPAPLPALVLNFNQTYPGTLTDVDGEATGFTATQRNKNDTFSSTASYVPSLLDLDTTGLGTLSVTTTSGSNGSTDNTLNNGLNVSFDGRAGRFTVSTRLVGPLADLNLPFQQGGVVFGPDQDNFVKLVAVAQSNGTPGIQFYGEQKAVGSTLGSIVMVPNPSTIETLDLVLTADPSLGTVQAAYRAVGPGFDTGLVTLPTTWTLTGGAVGRFFTQQSRAGIMTTSKSGTVVNLVFDRFAVETNP